MSVQPRPLTILFGTQSGVAERLALRIARLALKRGATAVTCLPADDVPLHRWHALDRPILIVCSNTSQGQPPASFVKTWCAMLQPDAVAMTGISYAVFGVGHSKFYKFNYMAKMIHNRMKQLGGNPLLLRGLGNESDSRGLDTALQPWLMQLWASLGWLRNSTEVAADGAASAVPVASGSESTTAKEEEEATFDMPLFPLYRVEELNAHTNMPYLGQHASDYLTRSRSPSNEEKDEDKEKTAAPLSAREAALLISRIYGTGASMLCEVVANRRVTPVDYEQDVHALRLRVLHHAAAESEEQLGCSAGVTARDAEEDATRDSGSSLAYSVGDSLGVWCSNRPALVEAMLHLLRLDGDCVVRVEPDHSHGLVRHPSQIFCHRSMTLRFLLTHYVDLEAFVSQEFIEMMLHYIVRPDKHDCVTEQKGGGDGDEEEDAVAEVEERLRELCDPRKYGEFMSFSYQEKRNVCEVLFDFAMVRPPLEMVLSFVRAMRPRYFSLASSPTADAQRPTMLDLLVARLDWQTPMRRHRVGMCSSYLVHALPFITRLPCCVLEGTLSLPTTPSPLICIATGTGVAPIRALLRECAARCAAASATGDVVNSRWAEVPIYLFFGCRHADRDYYFEEEWATMLRAGEEGTVLRQLQVVPAFSRAGPSKCYVQHKLGEHARAIGALLRPEVHACVYVCGNAATMPKDVEATLEQIMSAVVCDGDDACAVREMRRMAREGRYQVDTWTA